MIIWFCREVISRPQIVLKSSQPEIETVAEDDQSFLARLLSQLQTGKAESPLQRTTTGEKRIPNSKTPVKLTPGMTVPGNEGVLANFFNSLLAKKGPGSSPAKGVDGLNDSKCPFEMFSFIL